MATEKQELEKAVEEWAEQAKKAARLRHEARLKEANALKASRGGSADVRKAEAVAVSSEAEQEADLAKIEADAKLYIVKGMLPPGSVREP